MSFEYEIEYDVQIPLVSEDIRLNGSLFLPANPQGLIVFVHGSGSSRFSPRNRFVAQYLNRGAYGTLLFDLLTRAEEDTDLLFANLRFNIELLSNRLSSVTDWIKNSSELKHLPIGYFGASTGAAAAISAASKRDDIMAIVSRGGRPDMAGEALKSLNVPILLIVGGDDFAVIELNRNAFKSIMFPAKKIELIPGATHLFEEPGALDEVARLAVDWYLQFIHSEE